MGFPSFICHLLCLEFALQINLAFCHHGGVRVGSGDTEERIRERKGARETKKRKRKISKAKQEI